MRKLLIYDTLQKSRYQIIVSVDYNKWIVFYGSMIKPKNKIIIVYSIVIVYYLYKSINLAIIYFTKFLVYVDISCATFVCFM